MVDIIKPITVKPEIAETRLTSLELVNFLDAKGAPGEPGKYQVTIKTIDEQQTIDRKLIFSNGMPVRTRNSDIVFDPMLYGHVEMTRPDGSIFYLGQTLFDLVVAIDVLKGGLPPLPQPPIEPEEPPIEPEEPPIEPEEPPIEPE